MLCLFSCNEHPNNTTQSEHPRIEENHPQQKEKAEIMFHPDSSIYATLYLEDPSSTIKVLGDIMSLVDADKDLPDAFYKNQNGQEYLQVVFFPGNEANSISQFNVGYLNDLANPESISPIQLDRFQTESGIKLGLSKQEVILIKGGSYQEEKTNGELKLSYQVIDTKSPFLKRYNMPVYIAEYWFKDGKLTNYKFGFEYP